MSSLKQKTLLASGIVLGLGLAGSGAQATTMTFSVSGTAANGDGPIAASATLTTGANSLIISLSNTQTGIHAAGQLVSDIEISLSNTPSSPSITNSISSFGTYIDAPATTPVSAASTWGTTVSGGVLFLAGAGTGSTGGSPKGLIIGPTPFGSINPSITNHEPQLFQTGTFDLSVTGITSSTTFTDVKISFGTGPETVLDAVPAPPIGQGLLVGLAVGGLLFGARLWDRVKKRSALPLAAA
jgi:hypothetical protein